jgi:hypothetical protein
MVTASVARGRSLRLNGVAHGPGTVVELSVDEHAHLLAAGFLHDPRITQLTPGVGPQFAGVVNGVVRPK